MHPRRILHRESGRGENAAIPLQVTVTLLSRPGKARVTPNTHPPAIGVTFSEKASPPRLEFLEARVAQF